MHRQVFFVILFLTILSGVRSQVQHAVNCDISIDIPECPSNPVEKPGYYILLDQVFEDTEEYWNVSKPYDDVGCTFNFMRNQDNVTFPGKAYLWNTNVPVMECPYSMGEIKTMTVDSSNDTFKSYYFYGPGYVEAKVRQLYCSPGQGSAMWLWCVQDSDDPSIIHPDILDDNEIDVFETLPDDSNSFNITYHWRTADSLDKVANFYQVHTNPNSFTDWTVFAVMWCHDSIAWYINNKKICTMSMDDTPSGCSIGEPVSFYPPDGPFCLRFCSGPNGVGPHDPVLPETLPARFEIEYVRVYKPEGALAAPISFFSGTRNQVCITENSADSSKTILSANYYPDATYSWSSPAFEIEPYEVPGAFPQHHSGKVRIWVRPTVQGDKAYPVILSTTIFSHTEQDTAWYYVCTSAPSLPQNVFEATRIDGPLCRYEILHPISDPTSAGAEFFDESTHSWLEAEIRTIGNDRYAVYGSFEPQEYVTIKCREKNACGYSDVRHSGLTVPVPPPGTCGW